MKYQFECVTDGPFEVHAPMKEGPPARVKCPLCQEVAKRIFYPTVDVWHTEGSHKGDYGRGNHIGTKNDALNRAWSKATGETPPKPAADVPRNGSEKY